MTILLTGSTGFVGRHLLARLERDDHHVICYTRDFELTPELIDDDWYIDAIINCAGEITKTHKMVESNLTLTHRLLTFAECFGVDKFIQVGSSSEYGHMNEPRREDAFGTPTDLYSATKLAATALCQGFAAQYDMDVCVARPFSLYGPNDTPRKLIPRLYRSCMLWEPMKVGPGRQDYIYIDDFIEGLTLLLNLPREKTKGQIFNFGTGRDYSNTDVLQHMENLTGKRAHVEVKDGYAPNWVADITKARALGWEPKHDLQSGLQQLIQHESVQA